MLFVEQVLALSQLIKAHNISLYNLTNKVRELRYHGSLAYCNRNHYFKDWATVNIKNGNLIDYGYQLTKINFPYSAYVLSQRLANSKTNIHRSFGQCIAERESYINQSESLGFIPLKQLPHYLQYIKSGDIIGIVRNSPPPADAIHHLAIAYVHDNQVSMIHASDKKNFQKVIVTNSLMDYLNYYKDSAGIILLRPIFSRN
jgi:hypothetical protein